MEYDGQAHGYLSNRMGKGGLTVVDGFHEERHEMREDKISVHAKGLKRGKRKKKGSKEEVEVEVGGEEEAVCEASIEISTTYLKDLSQKKLEHSEALTQLTSEQEANMYTMVTGKETDIHTREQEIEDLVSTKTTAHELEMKEGKKACEEIYAE